ncbi:hypothetical protein H7100_01270 [Candidatus Saccharibacteria bacterium]|nr:hypothetical protein [Candidatus Saccharibacteria bacterium]
MIQQRLPAVNGDDGVWGDVLNQFLQKEHYNTGLDDPLNGGHKAVTIRPGTTVALTAPLKFLTGPLMTTPEAGAVEFLTDRLYFTQTTSTTRKVIAAYDDTSGATGDIHYRDLNGYLVRLAAGSTAQVLSIVSGLPSWQNNTTITRSINTISTATTAPAVVSTDYVYFVSGTTTLTLPTAVANTNRYSVTNTGISTITVATTSAQTINGSTTATLPIPNMSLDFISNGSNWVVE